MSNTDNNLQITDVYDCACDIFQEFEKIVAITGVDGASVLINKVKNVLELLEESVRNIEHLDKEYTELKCKCLQLSSEKLAKEEETKNLKQAFEELEESWTQESLNMKSLINTLRAENKILQHRLAERKDVPQDAGNTFKTIIDDQENFISKLKSSLNQKDIRFQKDQIIIESLNAKIEHLSNINTSLHLRYQEAKAIISTFNQEKSESEEKLIIQDEKLHYLEDNFDELKKSIAETCEFGIQNMLDVYKPLLQEQSANENRFKTLCQEQKKLKKEVRDLKLELALLKIQMDKYENDLFSNVSGQTPECVEAHGHFDQIFRLFLGIFTVDPPVCLLRNKRMYSL